MGARIVGHQKPCTICKEVKPFSEFYTQSKGKYVNGECKTCAKSRIHRWCKSNKDRADRNKRRWLNANRQIHNHRASLWRKRNPELINHYGAMHRAQKVAATPPWANEFFIKETYHLAQLRTKATGIKWEVDHIVPLQSKLVCGLHVENNLRVIPMPLNRKKSNIIWPDMPTENNYVR